MRKLPPHRRRVVLLAASATLLAASATMIATTPILLLNPLREAHHIGDAPYHLFTGVCLGLSISLLLNALSHQIRNRRSCSQ